VGDGNDVVERDGRADIEQPARRGPWARVERLRSLVVIARQAQG
jgi:hypothetical protein